MIQKKATKKEKMEKKLLSMMLIKKSSGVDRFDTDKKVTTWNE